MSVFFFHNFLANLTFKKPTIQKIMSNNLPGPDKFSKKKKQLLILAIIFDAIGMLTYLIPGWAEIFDLIWAPIAGLANMIMFGGWTGILGGLGTFAEELLPITDFIPSFLIMWFVKFVIFAKRTKNELNQDNIGQQNQIDSSKK